MLLWESDSVTMVTWSCYHGHVTMLPWSRDSVTMITWPCHHVTWLCYHGHVTLSPWSRDPILRLHSQAGKDSESLNTEWIPLDKNLDLYGNHEWILEKVCFHRHAYNPFTTSAKKHDVNVVGWWWRHGHVVMTSRVYKNMGYDKSQEL